MANRFFNCICGRFATIDMFAWVTGLRMIECQCGRKLKVGSMTFAKYAWAEYMRREDALSREFEAKDGEANQ